MPDEIFLAIGRMLSNLGTIILLWVLFAEINDLKKEIKSLKKQNYLIKWARSGRL